MALSGGGLFIGCESACLNNKIEIYNSKFEQNQPLTMPSGGGGTSVGFINFKQNYPSNNTVNFNNCRFINNSADF